MESAGHRQRLLRWTSLAAPVVLVGAHGWTSPYRDNQNTYLLHAVAAAGGPLRVDDLVRSTDPAPNFTLLARAVLWVGGTSGLAAVWWLAAIALFAALLAAARPHLPGPRSVLGWAAVMALLTTSAFDQAVGPALSPEGLLGGVAGQYALGDYLQPSAAGVLLVVGVVIAARSDHVAAPALLLLAPTVHLSYLLPAWTFVGALMVVRSGILHRPVALARDQVLAAARVLGVAAIASIPAVVTGWGAASALRGPDAADANRILADDRLPQHARPEQWFGWGTAFAIVAILAVLVLARRSGPSATRRLADLLLVATALTLTASVAVVVLDVASLRLLFPWRTSIVVLPLAASLAVALAGDRIRTALAEPGVSPRARPALLGAGAVVLAVSLTTGLASTARSYQHPVADEAAVALARQAPPVEGFIAPALEDVRLNAHRPVYVDIKSHPFRSADVVVWWSRVGRAVEASRDGARLCELLDEEHLAWALIRASTADDPSATCLTGWIRTDRDDIALVVRPRP